ncbi:MAG: murein biosynthesis integral membrane protein MurJ [Chloroflexi bacterium]|nr:murein biosynthesis integral membrane protein MurJ [Chloroflexota bacterium]
METPVIQSPEEPAAKLALPMGRVVSFATITALGFGLGQASGIVREMVVSAQFGLSAEIDAYKLSFLVPTLVNNIVAGSAITMAVMPVFARYLTAGRREEFWHAASVITNIVLIVTGLLTLLGMLFARPIIGIIGHGLAPSTQSIATALLVIMMPTLLLGALLNMVMAALNSVDRFVGPALIFLALNVGIIGTVILLSPYIGIYSVALGFLIGVVLQLVVQSVELRRERMHYSFKIDWHHPALREVGIAFLPVTALALVSQINIVIDGSMASGLPTGSIGALAYATTIVGAFYSVGNSLAIAVFPSLSRMAATNDMESTARAVMSSLRLLVFILVPLTFVLLWFSAPTVGLLLGRGRFDASAVQLTAQALAMYAIGLTAVGVVYVLQRAFYALSDGTTPLVVGSIVVALHVALNLALIPSMAHTGIALSASLTTTLGALVLILLFARRVAGFEFSRLARLAVQCIALALLTVLAGWEIASTLHLGNTTLLDRVSSLSLAAAAGGAYFAIAWMFKMPEAQMLLRLAGRFARQAASRAG